MVRARNYRRDEACLRWSNARNIRAILNPKLRQATTLGFVCDTVHNLIRANREARGIHLVPAIGEHHQAIAGGGEIQQCLLCDG